MSGFAEPCREVERAVRRRKPLGFLNALDESMRQILIQSGATVEAIAFAHDTALRTYLHAGHVEAPSDALVQALYDLATATSGGTVSMLKGVEKIAKWEHGKRIYVLHPETFAALRDSVDAGTVIPGDVLRRLPHPDAFVWFPIPITQPSLVGDVGAEETYAGFMVSGRTADHFGCRLDDERAYWVQLDFMGFVRTASLPFPVPQLYTLSIPMEGTYSLESLAEQCLDDVATWADAHIDEVRPLLVVAVAVLTYLASVGLDIEAEPDLRSARATRRRTEARRGAEVHRVGYRIGAALVHERRPSVDGGARNGGRHVAPHIRRGHFHTYRHGVGKHLTKVRWVAPIAVNRDRDESASVVTMHRIGSVSA